MNIKDKISDRSTNPKRLIELEQQYKIILPVEYREFLLTVNGGRPVERKFSFEENGRRTESAVGWFFGDCEDADYGLRSNFEIYKGRTPPTMCPIAIDGFGNLILVSSRDEDRGSVYFWDHEKEDSDDLFGNLSFVASNLGEFVKSLH